MNQEIWKDIAGYEGLYQVSSLGRVKSCKRIARSKCNSVRIVSERILKPKKTRHGYLQVALSKNGVYKTFQVHRIVATAFIQNDDLFAYSVNHKNEIKTDNRVGNLEWLSNADNVRYSAREGGTADFRGSKHPRARQVRCVETGEVFGCAADASRWLGLRESAVAVSTYKGYRAGGYHFEFI